MILTTSLPSANTRDPATSDERFVTIANVPVFAEHETWTREQKDLTGRVIKPSRRLKFGRQELQAVANRCNRRIEETGDYATIVIGHTPDPTLVALGRAEQPKIIGYAGPFKLGLIGKPGKQKYAILATVRIYREDWPQAERYPRRSAELWLEDRYEDMFLDPIALLGAETPRLDMGLLYSATLHRGGRPRVVERYSAVAPAMGNVFTPSEKYGTTSPTSTATAGAKTMALSPEDISQIVDAISQTDVFQWAKGKMAEESAPQPSVPQDDMDGDVDQPGDPDDETAPTQQLAPPSTAPPAAPMAPPPDKGVNPPANDKAKYGEHYSKGQRQPTIQQLWERVQSLDEQLKTAQGELATEREKRVNAERYSRLNGLLAEGVLIEPQKELDRLCYSKASDEQFEANIGFLIEHATRVPLNLMAPVFDTVAPTSPDSGSRGAKERYSKDAAEKATKLTLERRGRGEQVTYEQILADVVAGKV